MQIATFITIRAHKIKKKVGEKKLFSGSLIIVILCNLLLLMSNISIITIVLIFIIEGAFALTQPITETIKNDSIDSINRATILSAYAMIGNIIAAFTNIIISVAAKFSLEVALICCLIINIFAIIPMGLFFKEKS